MCIRDRACAASRPLLPRNTNWCESTHPPGAELHIEAAHADSWLGDGNERPAVCLIGGAANAASPT
eukprot:12094067-Alexandrium_andersonii.AAC.1